MRQPGPVIIAFGVDEAWVLYSGDEKLSYAGYDPVGLKCGAYSLLAPGVRGLGCPGF